MKVFIEEPEDRPKVNVEAEVAKTAEGLSENAQATLDSIKSETMPSTRELEPLGELLEALRAKSASFKKDRGLQQAESALQTTRAVITIMKSEGTDSKDEMLVLTTAREKKGEEVARLSAQALS